MLDVCFAELAAQLRPELTSVKAFVVLTDRGSMHRAVGGRSQPQGLCSPTLLWHGQQHSACHFAIHAGVA